MTALTLAIVVAFVLGYTCIATESLTKVNKAAAAVSQPYAPRLHGRHSRNG